MPIKLSYEPLLSPKDTHGIIHAPNWIGDHVMAFPFYEALRNNWKGRLTLLCREQVHSLTTPPFIDEKILIKDTHSIKYLLKLAHQIHTLSPTPAVSFCLPNSFSSALLFWMAHIPTRYGFAGLGNELLHTRSIRWGRKTSGPHESIRFLKLLTLYLSESTVNHALPSPLPLLSSAQTISNRSNVIVIAPLASHPLRVWPYFEELLQKISNHFPDFKFVLVGKDSKNNMWSRKLIRIGNPNITNLINQTSLDELSCLLSRARLLIANDSGVAHLATLSATPSLVLFGPGNPQYIAPLSSQAMILRNASLPCSPCEKKHCHSPYGYQACLRTLPPAEVLKAAIKLLKPSHSKTS